MGLGRFANFISKSIYNDIEEININNDIKKIISNCVIFDINFLIYNGCIDIENEINDINKILICKKQQSDIQIINILNKMIDTIINQSHWNIISTYDINNYENFIIYINTIIDKNSTILDNVIFNKILNLILKSVYGVHYIEYVQSICIFFDGVPSLSKIIEQRRRRIKKHIELKIKDTILETYSSNLISDNIKLYEILFNKHIFTNTKLINSITFNYSTWVENKLIIDKKIYPLSTFIINLENFLKKSLIIDNINIIINSSSNNGESDMKIFKYISQNNNNEEYCIHTIDSDLIHQMLVQQVYYNLNDINIKITICKYTNNIINNNIQLYNGPLIIKHILELYNSVNNITTNNIKIIWDLCFIFYLFGNDHIPSFIEISQELGMEYFLQSHYNILKNTNIINYTKTIYVNVYNLKLYINKIYSTNCYNITKILLLKFFKINYQLVILFIEKFKYFYKDVLIFLKKYIIYKGLKLSTEDYNNLYDDDLRKILINTFTDSNLNDYNNIDIFNLNDDNKKLFLLYDDMIEHNINYFEAKYNGLILYKKSLHITHNYYEDINNFINEKAAYLSNIKYPQYYDKYSIKDYIEYLEKINKQNDINIFNKNISNDYLKKMIHLLYTQFDNMDNYHSDNLTFYKYQEAPTLLDLINFLSNIKPNQINIWLQEIEKDNLYNKYITTDNHYKLITPYLNYDLLSNNKNFKYRNIAIFDYFS